MKNFELEALPNVKSKQSWNVKKLPPRGGNSSGGSTAMPSIAAPSYD